MDGTGSTARLDYVASDLGAIVNAPLWRFGREGTYEVAAASAKRNTQESGVSPVRPAVRIAPYDLLKQSILSGEFEPGQALVETSLATWCGVSRTPVREALRRLEQDGLVERNDHGLASRQESAGCQGEA